jgi:RND family efflux transporter MFP subunit
MRTALVATLLQRALLALAAFGVALPAPAAEPAGPVVPTVATQRAGQGLALDFDAVLEPVRQATISAQLTGSVLALSVAAGQSVRRGQPLVRLDDRELRAGLGRNDAAVTQAEAEFRQAEQALARSRDLLRSGFVSQAAVDAADNQHRSAQAALSQARAARQQAGIVQGFAELTAPFDGVVLATHVQAGDLALPGRALLTLAEPGRLRAVVQLPVSRAAAAGTARQLRVVWPDGRSVVPAASELLPAADPVSQTLQWRLLLPEGGAAARPGQTVRVQGLAGDVPAAASRASVPQAAILQRGELTAVYVVQGNAFVLRPVRLGAAAGGFVDVLAGLGADERVAADAVRAGLRGAVPQPR